MPDITWHDFDELPFEIDATYFPLRFRTRPYKPRWLWRRSRDGEWALVAKYDTPLEACSDIARLRRLSPNRMYRLTKTQHPPRSNHTPETKDPFA